MIENFIMTEFITTVAGLITSLGIIGGAVYQWVWKPYKKTKNDREKKKEKQEEKWRSQMLEISDKQTSPLMAQLETLAEQTHHHDGVNEHLEAIAKQNVAIITEMRSEFKDHNLQAEQRDTLIEQNSKILKQHDERLDNHSDRILILETVTGVPRMRNKNKEGDDN